MASPNDHEFYSRIQNKEHLNILNNQTTKPVELKKIEIKGGEFSDKYYESLLSPLINQSSTPIALKDLKNELVLIKEKLEYSGLFQNISIDVDLDKSSTPKLSKNDLLIEGAIPINAKINLSQLPISKISTYSSTTDHDASSGIRYLDPNFFKNASTLLVDINVNYDPFQNLLNKKIWDLTILTPFQNSPSLKFVLNPCISLIDAKSWASHTQFSKGGLIGVQKTWLSKNKTPILFTNGLSIAHRNIGDVLNSASDSIRNDAGDDFKIGFQSNLKIDTREFLGAFPLNGIKFDLINEFAGFNSVDNSSTSSNVEKDLELEKFNKTILKFEKNSSFWNNNFTTSFDFNIGSIFQLDSNKTNDQIHISDRFFLGGLNSLKGFHLNSVGLKNGHDYIGGSSFFKTGFTFYSKIPNTKNTSPLRLYNFINLGDVYNFKSIESFTKLIQNGDIIGKSAIATGVGLSYRSNSAIVDLSYSVPLSSRSQDRAKPGVSFSVALNFF